MAMVEILIGIFSLLYFLALGILGMKIKKEDVWWAIVIGALLFLILIRFR